MAEARSRAAGVRGARRRRARATSCSNSRASSGAALLPFRAISGRASCAKARRRWRWSWSRRLTWPRAIGSPMSTSPTPRLTRPIRRQRDRLRQIRRALPRARGRRGQGGRAARAQVVIEFKDYATALACYDSPEYQGARRCANPSRTATSSSSKATTDRNRLSRTRGAMADMRLVVTGAAGRMGRMLVKAIAETPGVTLGGALERAGSAALGQDAGFSPAPARRASRSPTIRCRDAARRRHRRFLRARRDGRNGRARRPGAHRPCDRHDGPDGGRLARARRGGAPRADRALRQHEPRRQPAGGAGARRGARARGGVRHRDRRNAPPHEGRRALGHRADARRSGGRGARHRA